MEVFACMEQVPEGHYIHDLMTRAQLDECIAEHDRIEKETETFDSGDLKKLKKFTKGVTSACVFQ